MKRIVFLLSILFCSVAFAHTIEWYVGDTLLSTTTCESGDNITPPTAPAKFGYHFKKWKPEYTRIEYLESTGTQWIDTGYVPNIGTKFEIRVQLLSGATQDIAGVSSAYIGPNSYFAPLTISGNACVYYFNSYHITGAVCRVNDIITASIYVMPTQAEIIQNNETLNITNTYTQSGVYMSSVSLYLFAGHAVISDNQSYAVENSIAKMFYAKIWQDNTLVRDFIPVLDGDGTPCMFDKVEKKFYYNAGTGQFIAGPIIGGQ